MRPMAGSGTDTRLIDRVMWSCFALLLIATGLVLAAVFLPLGRGTSSALAASPGVLATPAPPSRDVGAVLDAIASRRLIEPRVQRAVKETASFKRLIERLRLQGTLRKDEDHVAYILVQHEGKQQRKRVRRGDTILGLQVVDVTPGRVELERNGERGSLGR